MKLATGYKHFYGLFHTIKINYFQRYSMELAYILIITLGVNILHARFIFYFVSV